MKKMPFEPPTDHYDPQLQSLDEELCKIIQQRKLLSNENPGFPHQELITEWATRYNFYEDFLNSIFSNLFHEETYKPTVEPKGFVRNIPVLKSFEKEGVFYTLSFVRQFENASVVHLTIDREDPDEILARYHDPSYLNLFIENGAVDYECRNNFGGGTETHETYTYTVTPPLPADLANIKFIFKEHQYPAQKETGFQMIFAKDL